MQADRVFIPSCISTPGCCVPTQSRLAFTVPHWAAQGLRKPYTGRQDDSHWPSANCTFCYLGILCRRHVSVIAIDRVSGALQHTGTYGKDIFLIEVRTQHAWVCSGVFTYHRASTAVHGPLGPRSRFVQLPVGSWASGCAPPPRWA